jgi:uncharacterized integral membrane protein
MNHRPFEDWLLDDQPLTPEQKRDLQSHLRSCNSCSAIAESNMALHTHHMVLPAPGFSDRFQVRLAHRRSEQRWRQLIGTLVLVLGGLGLLYWVAGPAIQEALRSPAEWITTAVGYLLYVLSSIQAIGEASSILLRVVPNFVSPASLIFISFLISGFCFFCIVSIWRVNRLPQGV